MKWHPVRVLRALLADELARGASVNLVFTVANGVLGVLAAILAARALGPTGVGVLSIGFLLVEFASVVDNAPTAGFMREYAYAPTRDKVATVLVTKGVIGLLVTAALLALSPLLAGAFDVPATVPFVFAFIPAASILSSVATMAYEARRDMVRRNATTTVEAVVRVGLYALIALAPVLPVPPVDAVALATLVASVAASIAAIWFLPGLAVKGFDLARARSYLVFGAQTQASNAMNKVIFWFDIMLIDLILGHTTQGLYRVAYTLMSYLALLAGTVAIMLFPSIAHAHAEHRHEDVRRTLSLGFYYSVGLALPLALVLALFPGPILVLMFGPEFESAAWMLRALAGIGVLSVAVLPFEAFLPAVNRPDLALKVAIVMVAVNTGLDLWLIPRIGVAGAIWAAAATFTIGLAMGAAYIRRLGYELPRFKDVRDVLTERKPVPPP